MSEVTVISRSRALEIEYEGMVDSVVVEGSILGVEIESPEEYVIEVTSEGLQGPAGPEGPEGPPGQNGGGVTEADVTLAVETAVLSHELDPTPHPAYDDLPSLTLLFENGLA